jgi:hypothetical protein
VPVINALSSLWHPTQTLASLLTLARIYKGRQPSTTADLAAAAPGKTAKDSWSALLHQDKSVSDTKSGHTNPLECLKGLKVAWVGDCNNVVNDMIVTYPRLGIDLRVASPGGKDGEYGLDPRVWKKLCVQSVLANLAVDEWLTSCCAFSVRSLARRTRSSSPRARRRPSRAPTSSSRTRGFRWARRRRARSASRTLPASRSPRVRSCHPEPTAFKAQPPTDSFVSSHRQTQSSASAPAPRPTGSSCTACLATTTRSMTRSSTARARLSSRRPRTASGPS